MFTNNSRGTWLSSLRVLAVAAGASTLIFATARSAAAQNPDLVVNMTASPDPVAAGGVVGYSITVLNDGPTSTATGVNLAVPVPANASYSSSSGTGVSCSGMTVGQTGPGTLTCTLPDLPYLSVSALTVSLKTSVAGPFSITATAAENETDIDLSNNTITVTSTVVAGADIAFSIAGPSTIGSGSTTSYTLSLQNLGPDAATNLTVQFPVPTGFVLGTLPGGCAVAANIITCTVAGPVANGSTLNITPITGQISAASGSTITASASEAVSGSAPSGTAQDPNAANSSATFNTTVTAGSDLAIALSRSASAPFFVGSSFNFIVTSTYTGDAPTGLTMTDVVPTQYTIGSVAASQNGWSCVVVGQTVTCTKPSGGAAGANQAIGVITIPVTINATGLVTNTVTISAISPFDPNAANNTASDGGANLLTPTADLSIAISGPSPALVVTGQSFTETSNVSNGGPSLFYGTITMTVGFPAGVTVNSFTPNGWSCLPAAPQTGPVTETCTRTYTSGASLASGATTPSVTWSLTTTTSGSINTTGNVTTTGANVSDPNGGNNSVNFGVGSSVPVASADIALNKTVDLPTVAAGDVLTYTLEVVNNSATQASTNITLTDDFTTLINNSTGASGAGFVGFVTTANNASAVNCSTAISSSTSVKITCTIPSLPSCTTLVNCPTIVVQIRPGGDGGARSNTASIISSSIADPDLSNNSATASNTILPRADVTVSINATPNPVAAGQPLTYVVTAVDNGPSLAANLTVVDTLPLNTIFVSASPSAGSCGTLPAVGALITSANQFVTCNVGSVNNGAQKTVTIIVTPTNITNGTSLTNMVGVTTTTTEPTPPGQTNNQAQVTTTVTVPSLDLTISNIDSPDPVTAAVGNTMTYTLTVHNIGPSDAENVVITDNLPTANLSFLSAAVTSGTAGTCSTVPAVGSFGGTVVCNISRLDATATSVVTITMTPTVKGVATNLATVASDETAHGWENAANNTASQNTTVRTRTDIQLLSKVASAPTGFRRPFTWLIKVSNPTGTGLAEADTVFVNDNLPAGMQLTGTPTAVITGTSTINACTGTAGSTSFICSFGTLSSGGEADITVPVKMITYPSGGTSTNTATVTTSSEDINAANNSASGIATILSSSIAGNVYRDFNANGTQDGTDTGIASVPVTVTGTAFDATSVNATLNTDASGNFSFIGLPEGTYAIARGAAATPLLLIAPSKVGDHGGTATVVGTTPEVTGIALAQADAAAGYQFSLIPQARIGVAKAIVGSPTVSVTDGSYTIPVQILIKNYSLEPLQSIVINDPLNGAAPSFGTYVAGGAAAVLAVGNYTINAAPSVVSGSCGTATVNAAFDGSGTVKVADMTSLAASASCTLGFTLRWQPTVPLPSYTNQANASGTGTYSGQTPTDLSQNGANPDPDSDGDPTNNNTPTPITPALVADVTTSVSFPASINAGQTVNGTVTFKNTGPYTGSGMTYGTTLSANLTGVTFGNLPAGATATYTVGTGVVVFTGMPATLTLNQIASGDGLTGITVAYTQNASASSTVHSTIGTSTSQGTNANADVANATVGGVLIADVTTSMTFPASIDAGNSVVGHVAFKNTGPSVASGLTYTLTLSPNLTGVSFANTPAGAVLTYVSATGVVTFAGMPVTATLNQVLSADGVNGIQVTYTQNATATSTVASTIATSTSEGANANTNSANAAIGGQLVADVTTTLTFPVVANAGDPVAGTIVFKNNGPSIASGVSYTLTATASLPGGVTFGNLPAGATATYVAVTGMVTLTGMPATLNANQIASGNGTSGITMNYTQFNTGVSQINSTIATTTNEGANVALDAAVATPGGGLVADMTTINTFPASVNAGQPVTGTVLWRNNGPSIASGVVYSLQLTSGLAGVSFANLPAGATATYIPGTGVVTLTGMPSSVAIGAVISGDGVNGVTVNYTQPGTATSTITGNVSTTTSEGANLAPDLAMTTVGGMLIADITTRMTFPALVIPAVVAHGTVTFANNGPSIASGLVYSIHLAAQLTGVSFTNLPGGAVPTYNSVTGAVTFAGMPATLASGAIASADGLTGIAVNYTQPFGTTNVASAIATTTNQGSNAAPDSASAIVIGYQLVDLVVTKSNGLKHVAPNQTTVYTIRVANAGGADLAPGGTLTDSPSGLVLQSVACSGAFGNLCSSPPSVAALTSGAALPVIPHGAFYELSVTALVTRTTGSVSNTASTTLPPNFQDADSTTNQATDTDPIVTTSATQIGIAKAASPTQAGTNGHFSTTFALKIVNYGTDTLNNVRVTDPIASAAGGTFGTLASGTATAGQYALSGLTASGLTINPTFNGSSDLLAATGTLAPGANATVTFALDFVPASGTATFTNQATASGIGALSGTTTTDLSTSGTDPDPTGSGNPAGSNTPTTVGVPHIGLAKSASTPTSNGDGTYSVTFTMILANAGGMALTNVQVVDSLTSFGTPSANTIPAPGEYVITAGPTISNQLNGASIAAATNFTGAGSGASLLAPSSALPAATSTGAASQATLAFTVRYFPRYSGPCVNSAIITAGMNGGSTISAVSANGSSPDPTKSSPTTVECHGQNIGAALLVTAPVQTGARRFLIPYQALVRNMDSLSTATNVQLSDDIKATFPTAQSITIVAPGSASGMSAAQRTTALSAQLTNFANTTCTGTVLALSPTPFDGVSQKNMLAGNQNLLPREQCIFNFTVQVDFGTNPIPAVVQDMQTVATTSLTAGGKVIATDSSQNGPDPDPDTNGNPRNNSVPTPVQFSVVSALTITKTTPLTNVVKGQIVPYTIIVGNPAGSVGDGTDIRDQMPAGFSYREGTASVNGTLREPTISGRTLDWTGINVAAQSTHTVKLMLVVGAGVQPGTFTNNAQAYGPGGAAVSGVASATVRVIPDALFDCSDIIGKVFDDKNGNGVQDAGERGIPGARVISARGWVITADADGKFHVACAAIPDPDRGSNFVMKLDERSLPTGFVVTTENPRTVRVTDGKMTQLNFGATMRRTVQLDVTPQMFEGATGAELTQAWVTTLDAMRDTVGYSPFMLHVELDAGTTDESLARARIKAVIDTIRTRWRDKPWYKSMQLEQSLTFARKPQGGR